jgi:hypothetical protein
MAQIISGIGKLVVVTVVHLVVVWLIVFALHDADELDLLHEELWKPASPADLGANAYIPHTLVQQIDIDVTVRYSVCQRERVAVEVLSTHWVRFSDRLPSQCLERSQQLYCIEAHVYRRCRHKVHAGIGRSGTMRCDSIELRAGGQRDASIAGSDIVPELATCSHLGMRHSLVTHTPGY